MTLWYLALGMGVVTTIAVATLLVLILIEARKILAGTTAIWEGGKRIAGNTVHVAALIHTNRLLGHVLEAAPGLLRDLGSIRDHADGCSGCPACIFKEVQ